MGVRGVNDIGGVLVMTGIGRGMMDARSWRMVSENVKDAREGARIPFPKKESTCAQERIS